MWPFRKSDGTTPSSSSTNSEAAASAPPPESPRRTRSQVPSISLHPSATEAEQFEAVRLQAQEAVRTSRPSGRLTPSEYLHRVRSRSRGSPSPSPLPHRNSNNNVFTFNTMMDAEQLRDIISATVAATSAGQASNTAAIVQAAVDAAMSNQAQTQLSLRKPSFPPFDPKDIEQWLRRVEAAFDRLNITSPRFKLAHLDEKLVDKDPTINDIMSTAPTQENYDKLIAYLRKKHGRTNKQMAESVLQVPSREGRVPSQMWSIMKQKAGTVTLDDIMKMQLMKAMPPVVREQLQTKIKGKTGQQVADMCDEFFGPDGKLVEQPVSASGINAVRPNNNNNDNSNRHPNSALKSNEMPSTSSSTSADSSTTSFTSAFNDDSLDGDVHAVRFRQGQKQQFRVANNNNNGRSQSRGPSRSDNNNNNNGRSRNESRYGSRSSGNNNNNSGEKREAKCCFYHVKFGDKANRCEPGCMMHATFTPPKGQASR